jgi:predicted ArsR family transcriptional regulator
LIIGKDVVRKVLEDVGKTIQEQIRNEMDEYKQETEKRKLELIDIINLKVKDIEDKGNVSLAKLNDAINSSIDAFDAKVKQSIQEIENLERKGKETLESVANDGVQKVNKEKENAIKEIQKAAEKCKALFKLSKPTYVLTNLR